MNVWLILDANNNEVSSIDKMMIYISEILVFILSKYYMYLFFDFNDFYESYDLKQLLFVIINTNLDSTTISMTTDV